MSDLKIEQGLSYEKMLQLYNRYFSLGNLNCDFKNKIALVSLICHLTYELKLKKPDVTHYRVIMKLAEGKSLPDDFVKALAVICDDFAYGCKEFITFDLKGPEIIKQVKNILDTYTPF